MGREGGVDQESPSDVAAAAWPGTAHSPCPLPSPVKVQMSPLTPSKLSLSSCYLAGFYRSHVTAGESRSVSVCGWQVWSRDKGREASSSGGRWFFLPPAVPPLPPVSTTLYPASPHAFRALLGGLGPAQGPVLSTGLSLGQVSGSALRPCLCGPRQKLLCILSHLSSWTMSSSSCPCDQPRLLTTLWPSLWPSCEESPANTGGLTGFPARLPVASQPQPGSSLECLPQPPFSKQAVARFTSAAAPSAGCGFGELRFRPLIFMGSLPGPGLIRIGWWQGRSPFPPVGLSSRAQQESAARGGGFLPRAPGLQLCLGSARLWYPCRTKVRLLLWQGPGN